MTVVIVFSRTRSMVYNSKKKIVSVLGRVSLPSNKYCIRTSQSLKKKAIEPQWFTKGPSCSQRIQISYS